MTDVAEREATPAKSSSSSGLRFDEAWFAPGTIIDGDLRIERLLGQGGMGVVVAARDLRTSELVAVKLIRPERASDASFTSRFLREARIALHLQSEHTARVLRVGRLESGLPFIVMEYLAGETMESLLRRSGQLPIAVAVDYMLQACEAVANAHASKVVHRDLKPSNLFVTPGPDGTSRIKVIDFGISKVTARDATHGQTSSELTTTAGLLGSPRYMSPEQLGAAGVVGARTDIWSLGIILYELLTGGPPYIAESVATLYARILRDPIPSLVAACPTAPPGLDAVYRQCLVKDPQLRMPSVVDLAVALARYGTAAAQASLHRITTVTGASGVTTLGSGTVAAATRHQRRRWFGWRTTLAAAGALFCVGVIADHRRISTVGRHFRDESAAARGQRPSGVIKALVVVPALAPGPATGRQASASEASFVPQSTDSQAIAAPLTRAAATGSAHRPKRQRSLPRPPQFDSPASVPDPDPAADRALFRTRY